MTDRSVLSIGGSSKRNNEISQQGNKIVPNALNHLTCESHRAAPGTPVPVLKGEPLKNPKPTQMTF